MGNNTSEIQPYDKFISNINKVLPKKIKLAKEIDLINSYSCIIKNINLSKDYYKNDYDMFVKSMPPKLPNKMDTFIKFIVNKDKPIKTHYVYLKSADVDVFLYNLYRKFTNDPANIVIRQSRCVCLKVFYICELHKRNPELLKKIVDIDYNYGMYSENINTESYNIIKNYNIKINLNNSFNIKFDVSRCLIHSLKYGRFITILNIIHDISKHQYKYVKKNDIFIFKINSIILKKVHDMLIEYDEDDYIKYKIDDYDIIKHLSHQPNKPDISNILCSTKYIQQSSSITRLC